MSVLQLDKRNAAGEELGKTVCLTAQLKRHPDMKDQIDGTNQTNAPEAGEKTNMMSHTAHSSVIRVESYLLMALTAVMTLGIVSVPRVDARPFRPGQMPNGSVLSCANCHVNPAGGGTRTPFGNAVFAIVGGPSSTPFWSPTLAALDSDGDGLTNGQELGDPDGNGVPTAGVPVSNPGNRPPPSRPPLLRTRSWVWRSSTRPPPRTQRPIP